MKNNCPDYWTGDNIQYYYIIINVYGCFVHSMPYKITIPGGTYAL